MKKNYNKDNYVLTWKDVDLKIRIKEPGFLNFKTFERHILKNMSGIAYNGECLAIMGGSGAGKSTLLNILSNRFEKGKHITLRGEVMLNNNKMIWDKYRTIMGFVMQRDIFLEVLTIREIFNFVVELKHPTYT